MRVHRRRLVPLGVAVTALLVVAAVATRGRPLGGGGSGHGPSAGFFDYVFTTIVIFAGAAALIAVWTLLVARPARSPLPSTGRRYLSSTLALVGAAAIAWLLFHSGFERALRRLEQKPPPATQGRSAQPLPAVSPAGRRGARLRWDEVAVALALLAAAGVVAAASRSRLRHPEPLRRRSSQRAVSLALDSSLDDLRAEPDLRKAIIAAYARMERALAGAGLPAARPRRRSSTSSARCSSWRRPPAGVRA